MMRAFRVGFAALALSALAARAQTIVTVGGQGAQYTSIQSAIDAAPEGATIRIAAGDYDGDLVVRKPLTLEGAGWDKTTIVALQPTAEQANRAVRETEQQIRQVLRDERKVHALRKELAERLARAAIRVEGAQGVTLRGLKLAAQPIHYPDGSPRSPLVLLDLNATRATVTDCVITGSPMDGVTVRDGADVEIRNTLIAGMWMNGINVGMSERTPTGPKDLRPCKLRIADSDVRNCYHVGIYIHYTAAVTVERCRVSGSAWHGIRWGGGAQTVSDSRIFRNARTGIYADDGKGTVSGNVFADNEGAGITFFSGADTVVGNTFARNGYAGVSAFGKAKPTVERNVFVGNAAAVMCGAIANVGAEPKPVGSPDLKDNWFWRNEATVLLSKADRDAGRQADWVKLDALKGNAERDPGFAGPDTIGLAADSPAIKAKVGATDVLPADSPWPLQPQELAIIPDGFGRDWQAWKKPSLEPLRPAEVPPAQFAAAAVQNVSYEKAFTDLYEVLGRDYPCFEMKQIDWAAVGKELLPRAKQVKDDRKFGLLVLELVARLQDSHALVGPGSAQPPVPEFPMWDPGLACLIDDRGKPVVYYVDPGGPADKAGVKPGTTIVSVGGMPAEQALVERMKELSRYSGYSSDRYLLYHAAQFLPRVMKQAQEVAMEVEDSGGNRRTLDLPATLRVRYLPRLPVPIKGIADSANVSWTMLDGDVGYVYVRRIGNDLVDPLDRAVGALKHAKGMILDVRGNSGGGFDADRSFRNFDVNDGNEPLRPRFAGPMAVLIDARCISAGEGWASWFIAKKRARFFGETTAGASSRKTQYTLGNGLYTVTYPVKAYAGFLDRPIERRGLEPDEPVRQNAKDLAEGRDTVLKAAKKYLSTVK